MKEYYFELENYDHQADIEKIIKKYIFDNSNMVCFTEFNKLKPGFFYGKKDNGVEYDQSTDEFDTYNKNFIKTIVDNKLHGIKQFGWKKYVHHYFKLSDAIKKAYEKEEMFGMPPDNLYGLGDPMFYNNDKLIALVINHERMVIFYSLDEKQLQYFSDHKIKIGEIRK